MHDTPTSSGLTYPSPSRYRVWHRVFSRIFPAIESDPRLSLRFNEARAGRALSPNQCGRHLEQTVHSLILLVEYCLQWKPCSGRVVRLSAFAKLRQRVPFHSRPRAAMTSSMSTSITTLPDDALALILHHAGPNISVFLTLSRALFLQAVSRAWREVEMHAVWRLCADIFNSAAVRGFPRTRSAALMHVLIF